MRRIDKTEFAFFSMLRAGLWGQRERLLSFKEVSLNITEIYRIAHEQSVVGLVCSGIENMGGIGQLNLTDEHMGMIIGELVALEDRNSRMNEFVRNLISTMSTSDIFTLLVKGQGIAQCYDKPLWRTAGDVDLFLDAANYDKAKAFFMSNGYHLETEHTSVKHLGAFIGEWTVELHGSLRCGLSGRIDRVLDDVQSRLFLERRFRLWDNASIDIYLPCADDDVIFVFTHILKHFYKGGIGLRQLCDWCRLLWIYRDTIDREMLEKRMKKMGLINEWKSFGALAVEYLGMPSEAMPLYDGGTRWKRKAEKIMIFVLSVGNFGHNRDMTYHRKYPYLVRKSVSFWRRVADVFRHADIFPLNSFRFLPVILFNGLRSAAKGE